MPRARMARRWRRAHVPLRLGLAVGVALQLFGVTATASAAGVRDVHVFRDGVWVRADVDAADLLDARTRSTVESGLPGTCVYRLRLETAQGTVLAERVAEYTLRLDLWEDHYVLDGPGERVVFATLAAADSAWSHPRGLRVAPLVRIPGDAACRVDVEVAVQPLAAADEARLSRYVSRNSGDGGGDRREFALDVGGLLKRFFGARRTAESSRRYHTPAFRALDLEEVEP